MARERLALYQMVNLLALVFNKFPQGRTGAARVANSRRTLAISGFLIEMLSTHLAALDIDVNDEDAFLFTSPEGGPIRYANWRNRIWLLSCKRAGLVGIGFHDLRRLSATTLVHEGVDLKTAQTKTRSFRSKAHDWALCPGSAAPIERLPSLGEILYLPSTEDSDDESSARETAGQSVHAKKRNRSRTTSPKLAKWCGENAL